MYVISSISGILISAAFIMINWTIINQTYVPVTPHFLCASMLGSAYLITFVLAILNFLFADFMTLDEEDDMEQYSKVQIVWNYFYASQLIHTIHGLSKRNFSLIQFSTVDFK